MFDFKTDVLQPTESLEGLGHTPGLGFLRTLLDRHWEDESPHAVVVDVRPFEVNAAQVVARQLLELLASPEGLVGDIDIDAESSATRLDCL
jgi:hypothetical protein